MAGFVRIASSPIVVARICAPLSIDTEPPVNIGRMTLSASKVVRKGCFAAILTVMVVLVERVLKLNFFLVGD